jgi:DNA-binding transcriptional regulator/RsmH inhibitor MraZ
MNTPPRGVYPGRLDDEGRLQLPTAFVAYFQRLLSRKFFVTSLDGYTMRIYPWAEWQSEMDSGGLPASEFTVFNARDLGAESEMDSAGRILIPDGLRQQLQMENVTVRMYFLRSHIQVIDEALYEELRDPAGFMRWTN